MKKIAKHILKLARVCNPCRIFGTDLKIRASGIKVTILVIVACIALCACPIIENGHRFITIVNRTSKTIMFQPREFENTHIDTAFTCLYGFYIIQRDSSYKFDIRGTWENELGTTHYLQFLLMDRDVYLQYHLESCDTIRKYVPILYRYQLKLEDLQRMNWTVIYPPEP